MNARWNMWAMGLVLAASLGLGGAAAQEREVAEPREVREVHEIREVAVHETEVRETGSHESPSHETGAESGRETRHADIGWQADAIRDEAADRDAIGNPVRQGEVIAFGLPAEAERTLAASGYRVIRRTALASLGEEVVRLGIPRGRRLADALREVREAAPGAVTDFDHYYGLGLAAREKPRRDKGARYKAATPAAPAPRAVSVGMIDTAVTAHPALGGARVVSWKAGEDPTAPAQHGTAVASLMAARGSATIYSANIFRGPAAHPFTSIDILAEAMEWMLGQGAPVINMSIAGPPNALLEKLVAIAGARGRTIVAAAGNGGPVAPPVYPAALPGVVAVTAVDPALRVYRYANHGRYIAVAAQGVGVLAARAEGGYARFTGTSFAAPLVAARLARCRAGGGSSAVCTDQLYKAARDLGVPGYDDTYGYGYID